MSLLHNFPCVFLCRALSPRFVSYPLLILFFASTEWDLPEWLSWLPGALQAMALAGLVIGSGWTDANLGGEFFFVFKKSYEKLSEYLAVAIRWTANDLQTKEERGCAFVIAVIGAIVLVFFIIGAFLDRERFKSAIPIIVMIDIFALVIGSIRYLPTFARDEWPGLNAIWTARRQVIDTYLEHKDLLKTAFPRSRLDAELLVCIPHGSAPEMAFKEARDMIHELLELVATLKEEQKIQEQTAPKTPKTNPPMANI